MQATYNLITEFIKEERADVGRGNSNYFDAVFGEVAKYYEYLMIIWPRYKDISKSFVQAFRKMSAKDDLKELSHQQTQLHLELESIFIFSSILLDRLAACTQYYFGEGSKQWRSFEAMKDYFVAYCVNKALSKPDDRISEVMNWLHQYVSKFRHILIVHKHEKDSQVRVRLINQVSSNEGDDDASFSLMIMNPEGQEEPAVSEKPQNILGNLSSLLELWIDYLHSNRDKRKLSPNA